ncbi:endonuclease domain-containing protein [Longimicrobium sp.]|uniref:endonuclease domain-containing protein n=1 Tax=Longimicrobium sp. TaxID=2029185 RepID=UPI002E2EE467|nr:endonuclease domain-containing protein [Longimicrobium sp.]HEX6042535.1 endonuclease domain-containing protein [Longimicrobium sp.]
MQRKTSRTVRARARELRQEETYAERLLWRVLRNRAVNGLKFRRQHPLDGFVIDFFCAEARLCVELDGGIHDPQQERDAARTAQLEARGLRVIRFRNEEVENEMDSVLRRIAKAATRADAPAPASRYPFVQEGADAR